MTATAWLPVPMINTPLGYILVNSLIVTHFGHDGNTNGSKPHIYRYRPHTASADGILHTRLPTSHYSSYTISHGLFSAIEIARITQSGTSCFSGFGFALIHMLQFIVQLKHNRLDRGVNSGVVCFISLLFK